jgi:hypothetical protein
MIAGTTSARRWQRFLQFPITRLVVGFVYLFVVMNDTLFFFTF